MRKIILILATVLSLCTANKAMAYDFSADNNGQTIYYNIIYNTATVEVSSGDSDYKDTIVIPDIVTDGINTYTVAAIGLFAFSNCYELISVIIPNSVTRIGDYAFYDCSGLINVTIPNSVTSIGSFAFHDCSSLTNVTIPNSVISLGGASFYGCRSLTNITIPCSVTTIGEITFYGCTGLTSITIPNSVTSIGVSAFSYCTSLTSVTNLNPVPQDIEDYSVFGDVDISLCTLTVPTSAVTAYQNAPEWKDFAPIVGGGILFSTRANLPALGNVTANILEGLYPITTVTLTATPLASSFLGWTSGETDLGNANPLTLTLTQDTVIIANFGNADSIHLTTAGTLKDQPNIRNTTRLTITGNIDARDIQFMRDSIPLLVHLDLSNTNIVEYSGTDGTDYERNLTYPANEIPQYSFFNARIVTGKVSLTSLSIPNSVTNIGKSAFSYCSGLTALTIPNSVTSIGDYAFSYCGRLTALTIPNSVISIGEDAFRHCTGLTSFIVEASNPYYSSVDGVLFSKLQDTLIQYPIHKAGHYTIPNTVTTIQEYAFEDCIELTSITIPHSVIDIRSGAFYACSGLIGSLIIPNSVVYIGHVVFVDCSGLTSITFGNSVKIMGYSILAGCDEITEISVRAVKPPQGNVPFSYTISDAILLHVPCGTRTAYQNDDSWNWFVNIIEDVTPFDITLQSNHAQMGTAAIIQDNICTNSKIVIEATPNAGYRFVKWDDNITDNPRTVTVTSDTNITAIFDITDAITDIATSPIAIYPNPARDNVHIILPENISQAVFTLYDMQGKALIQQNIGNQDVVSVNNLAAGIYIYNVRTDKENYQGKLIRK